MSPLAATSTNDPPNSPGNSLRSKLLRWAVVIFVGVGVLVVPVPEGITAQSWRLLAIFVATITGSIVRPLPGGAMVLLGVTALAISGTLPIRAALGGFADPIVWLVLAAFFIARAMIKTGLGRRIALVFIRTIGSHSLGLVYALISTDAVLATIIPSTGARSGGIVFPIAKSLAEAYDSRPGPTAGRLGAFLMTTLYQADVIVCAMFLTGQASNVLIAGFAAQTTNIELSYASWALYAMVPGLAALAVTPQVLYRIFPPQITRTPAAADFARSELLQMGSMRRDEKLLLAVFLVVAILWVIKGVGGLFPVIPVKQVHSAFAYVVALDYSIPPLVGVGILLIGGVLDWNDILGERGAWDVFIWYGGLVRMAEALSETGITQKFAEAAGEFTAGWVWWVALGGLALLYFYAHYGFASITAHATAMYKPFLIVVIAAGAPTYLAVLSLAFFSNLSAGLTHYGTTPAPIYFGANYVTQKRWWTIGLIASLVNIPIWIVVGFSWWKLLGLW